VSTISSDLSTRVMQVVFVGSEGAMTTVNGFHILSPSKQLSLPSHTREIEQHQIFHYLSIGSNFGPNVSSTFIPAPATMLLHMSRQNQLHRYHRARSFQFDPDMSQGIHHSLVCYTSRIDRLFSHPQVHASFFIFYYYYCGHFFLWGAVSARSPPYVF
jgi:hypothetical protein